MVWLFLYLYFVGAVNDLLMTYASEEVDMSDWATHVNILLWPITVPASIVIAIIASIRKP